MVSDEVHNVVRHLQLRLAKACGGNAAPRLTPHITLKQPFHAREMPAVEAYFDTLAPRIHLDEVHLRNIGYFEEDPTEGVAFVDVAPHRPLEDLRRRILDDL